MNFCNASRASSFMNMSAVFSEDRIYVKRTYPSLVHFFTKWYLTSMCLVWQWFLLFKLFEVELSLSTWMIIGSRASPILSKYLVNQRAWVITCMNAMYSVSTVDSTTVSHLLLSQIIVFYSHELVLLLQEIHYS